MEDVRKEYVEPDLSIDYFDSCDTITTSETGGNNKDESFPDNDDFWNNPS